MAQWHNFYERVMPLAYADDVDIIGRSDGEVAVAFSKFAEETRSIDLAVKSRKQNKVPFIINSQGL